MAEEKQGRQMRFGELKSDEGGCRRGKFHGISRVGGGAHNTCGVVLSPGGRCVARFFFFFLFLRFSSLLPFT